ncbi:MAG: GNAT family N-acetyltransferase [Clostridiales bacterium]|jgi:phosphinothricin acetyltransferase|nr:GNAT family N-acetyltransferase [Clostridiales bacterium]
MSSDRLFRLADAKDSDAVLKIYAPYVRDTVISLELEVPSPKAFHKRVEGIVKQYPFVVCETNGEMAGYAYAAMHRERTGYRYDVDVSVYTAPEYFGRGIARALYDRLFALLAAQGYYNAYAGCNAKNRRSEAFHYKCGFKFAGAFHNAGHKFGEWHDVNWYEKTLREYDEIPAEIQPISGLPAEYVREVLSGC